MITYQQLVDAVNTVNGHRDAENRDSQNCNTTKELVRALKYAKNKNVFSASISIDGAKSVLISMGYSARDFK